MFSLHRWLHWRQRWTLHSEYGQPLTISCGRCVHLSKINYVVYYSFSTLEKEFFVDDKVTGMGFYNETTEDGQIKIGDVQFTLVK